MLPEPNQIRREIIFQPWTAETDFEKIMPYIPKREKAKAFEYYCAYVKKGQCINKVRYRLTNKQIYLAVRAYTVNGRQRNSAFVKISIHLMSAIIDYLPEEGWFMIVNAEQALIGALMMEPRAIKDCGVIRPDMFCWCAVRAAISGILRAHDFGYQANLCNPCANIADVSKLNYEQIKEWFKCDKHCGWGICRCD